MTRSAALFRQADLARVLRASKVAGVPVRVEIGMDGKIVILPIQTVDNGEKPPTGVHKQQEVVL